MELKSKTLTSFFGKEPLDYDLKFVHHHISLADEGEEEYKLLETDLENIKRNVEPDFFKVFFSNVDTLEKINNNTEIINNYYSDIYIKLHNKAEYEKVKQISDKINIIINFENLSEFDKLDESIILETDNISNIAYGNLKKLQEKYNICKINLGQISYMGTYFVDYLKSMAEKLKYLNIGYKSIENEIVLSNDIYTIDEFYQIESELYNLVNETSNDKSDYENFCLIYSKIIKKIKYDDYGLEHSVKDSQNLYGGLINNTCVCEGYTKILKQALNLIGISSIVTFGGEAKKDGGHLWNQVKIDGKWYNADATVDAYNVLNGDPICLCLVSDDKLLYKSDHINDHKCMESYNQNYVKK